MKVSHWFPTFVGSAQWEDEPAHAALRSFVEELARAEPAGPSYSVDRGWQSRRDLQRAPELAPWLVWIGAQLESFAGRVCLQARFEVDGVWANATPGGSRHGVHVHPGAHLSGVYYLCIPPGAGSIFFEDPRPANVMTLNALRQTAEFAEHPETWRTVEIPPRERSMLLFPSWLSHGTHGNSESMAGSRLSLSFNASATKVC